jgi:hypothetical protein
MKIKDDKVTKGILFAGCSFTWGQGLYYYSNMSTLKEPPPDTYNASLVKDAHNKFRKTLYFPRLVANHFNTFEVSMIQNGGAEATSVDYLKVAFGLMGCNSNYLTDTYSFSEIEYIVLQTSQPQRNTYHYDYINSDGSVDTCEFRTFSPETHDKFYRYLVEQKKCTLDEWYAEHCKDWFQKIKKELQFYESKGIKTFILNWETDYIPFYKNDEWMHDRLITFEYNGNRYDTIRTMMNANRHLHINSDYEHFEITPKDHHPSKECHTIIADAVIKKIEFCTKIKKIRYESKLI